MDIACSALAGQVLWYSFTITSDNWMWRTCPFLITMICLESLMAVFLAVSALWPGILHREYMSNWDMHNGRLREKSGGTEALLGEGDKEYREFLNFCRIFIFVIAIRVVQCGTWKWTGNGLYHCKHSVHTGGQAAIPCIPWAEKQITYPIT